MDISSKTRKTVIIIACILLLAAVCLHFISNKSTSLQWVRDELAAHSIELTEAEIIYEGNASNTDIRSLLVASDASIEAAVKASTEAGFSANIDEVGNVVLLRADVNSQEKMTIYVFESQNTPMHIALCFIQNEDSGKVRAAS
ncbi:MAG: hypothetical protein IJO48_04540 [Clostridia bacterium]|nr:hypothetical protein [Clostridia bacterium]